MIGTGSTGTVRRQNGTIYLSGAIVPIAHESNVDITMSRPYVTDHNLTITKRRIDQPPRINGYYDQEYPIYYNGARFTCENRMVDQNDYTYCPTYPAPDFDYWKTKALANLNPERPTFDIPLFLWELKDLPRMVQHAGWLLKGINNPHYRHHWQDAGSVYLAYKFGWEALVRDVLSMFDLTAKIAERVNYLKSLETGSRYRRVLSNGIVSVGPGANASTSFHSQVRVTCSTELTVKQKVWFSANAKLKDALPADSTQLVTLSRDIVTGMRLNPERVWDFIPFTWLSDYFLNLGDYIEAHGTLARVTVTRMNIMATTRVERKFTPTYVQPGLSCSGGLYSTTWKRRAAYANPTASVRTTPFITEGQVSIIAALASTRVKRAIR